MNTKIVLVIVFLILIVGGGFVFMKTNNQNGMNKELKTVTPSTAMVKSYTLTEIAKHSTESDCWMEIENKVYDVTKFIPNHPGGQLIIRGCGKDASQLFNERPTNNKGPHPESAKQMLEKFYIGELK